MIVLKDLTTEWLFLLLSHTQCFCECRAHLVATVINHIGAKIFFHPIQALNESVLVMEFSQWPCSSYCVGA